MSRTKASTDALNEFYGKMSEVSNQAKCSFFKCNTGNLQLYSILKKPEFQHFLFIKMSLISTGWWGLQSSWLDLIQKVTLEGVLDEPSETPVVDRNWAVILLRGSQRGFLIPSSDLLKMVSELSIDQKGELKIVESKINTRYQFWSLKKLLEKITQLKGCSPK